MMNHANQSKIWKETKLRRDEPPPRSNSTNNNDTHQIDFWAAQQRKTNESMIEKQIVAMKQAKYGDPLLAGNIAKQKRTEQEQYGTW